MRSPLIALALSLASVSAEDQERSLIDRLLRPNMELRNPQQGKVFRTGSAVNSRGKVVEPTVKPKSFPDIGILEMKELHQKKRRDVRAGLAIAPHSNASREPFIEIRPAYVPPQVTTSPVRDVRPVYDANLKVAGRKFTDQRSFRDRGKSQKSLDLQNPPLTIDQVRELLNKNK